MLKWSLTEFWRGAPVPIIMLFLALTEGGMFKCEYRFCMSSPEWSSDGLPG